VRKSRKIVHKEVHEGIIRSKRENRGRGHKKQKEYKAEKGSVQISEEP